MQKYIFESPRPFYKRAGFFVELILVGIIFSGLTLLFFKDTIFSDRIICFRDLGRYFYPLREYAAILIKRGVPPLWNPFIFCGNPLAASHQPAVFYPFSLIYLIGNFDKAFNNFIYLHFVLSGLFMYLFLRDRSISASAAMIGAVTFTFSGCMLASVNVLTFFSSAVWMPITLWAFFRAMESKEKNLYVILTALLLSYEFLSGEPMILYMTIMIMLFASLRNIRLFFYTGALSVLISSYQFLPVMEFFSQSDRVGMTYDMVTKWSMAPHNLLDIIFPCITDVEAVLKEYWAKQNWLLDYYLGLLPILMAPIAILFVEGKKKFLAAALLAIAIILSLGRHTLVYGLLFKYLPGFSFFRYPVKYFYLATFSLAWLTALGWDFYEKNSRINISLMRYLRIILYSALFISLVLLFVDMHFKELVKYFHQSFFVGPEKILKKCSETIPFIALGFFTIRRTLVFFLIFALFLYFGAKRRINMKLVSLAAVLLVTIDLYTASYDINFSQDIEAFKKPRSNIEFLMKDKSLFRIISSPANSDLLYNPAKDKYSDVPDVGKERLYDNRMMEYGIYDVGGYEGVSRTRMSDMLVFIMFGMKSPGETKLLDILNVKYVASPKDLNVAGYKLVKKSKIANLYENMNVLPRAFLSDEAILLKTREKIFEKFKDPKWDPRKEVILEEPPTANRQPQTAEDLQGIKETAEIIKYLSNEVIIKATVNSPKFLILSDSYYPGWKVYVDGRLDKIYRANYIMRAVMLLPGTHIVRFIFDPFSLKLGLAISLATLIAILFYIVYHKRK